MYSNDQISIESPAIGQAPEQDENFTRPQKQRFYTDVLYMNIFVIIVLVWIAISICAIGVSPLMSNKNTTSNLEQVNDTQSNVNAFKEYLTPTLVGLLIFLIDPIILTLMMSWISAWMVWTFFSLFHGSLLIGAELNGVRFIAVFIIPISAVTLFSYRKHIGIAMDLIDSCTYAVSSMWPTTVFAIIPAILKIAVIYIGFIVGVCIWAIQVIEQNRYANEVLNFLHVFNVIVCIWIVLFISAISEITWANAFGTWHWTHVKAKAPCAILGQSAILSLRYHTGTAALGGPIINILRVIYLISSPCFKKQHKNILTNTSDSCTNYENFLKRYSRSALVMCALHGKGLHDSAKSAFELLQRNALGCIDTHVLSGLIFGICKIVIAGSIGICGCIYFQTVFNKMPIVPVIILIVGAHSVLDVFLSLYAIAVDTLILCGHEDAEQNGEPNHHPYFIPKRLKIELVRHDECDLNGCSQPEAVSRDLSVILDDEEN